LHVTRTDFRRVTLNSLSLEIGFKVLKESRNKHVYKVKHNIINDVYIYFMDKQDLVINIQ